MRKRRRRANSQAWINATVGVFCGVIVLVFIIVLLIQSGKTTKHQKPVPVAAQPTATATEPPTEPPTEPSILLDYPSYSDNATELMSSNVYCENAVLVDVTDHSILAYRNAEERIFPASMTKIMTLLIAAENIENLDDTFTMTYDIIAPLIQEDASRAGFAEEEVITMKDVLYGIALPSGADATTAAAIYVAGSEDAFVDLMNEKAKELGLKDTHFMNASGLHDNNHYSTALDIAMLMSYVMQNDICREVLGTYQYTTSKTEQHPEGIPLVSTMYSRMYGNEVDGISIIAGKTGYTDEAGHALVSCAVDETGKEYIAVTAHGAISYWKSIFDTFAIYGLIDGGYPLPDDIVIETEPATDANGNPIETETAS